MLYPPTTCVLPIIIIIFRERLCLGRDGQINQLVISTVVVVVVLQLFFPFITSCLCRYDGTLSGRLLNTLNNGPCYTKRETFSFYIFSVWTDDVVQQMTKEGGDTFCSSDVPLHHPAMLLPPMMYYEGRAYLPGRM